MLFESQWETWTINEVKLIKAISSSHFPVNVGLFTEEFSYLQFQNWATGFEISTHLAPFSSPRQAEAARNLQLSKVKMMKDYGFNWNDFLTYHLAYICIKCRIIIFTWQGSWIGKRSKQFSGTQRNQIKKRASECIQQNKEARLFLDCVISSHRWGITELNKYPMPRMHIKNSLSR